MTGKQAGSGIYKAARRAIGSASAIAAFVLLGMGPVHCQSGDRIVSEGEVVTATAISAFFNLASVGECFHADAAYFPYLFLGTVTLQNLPSLIYGSQGALGNYGLQLGLDGLVVANEAGIKSSALEPVLFNFAHKYSMFGTYAAYADLRLRTKEADYSQIKRYSFTELLSAPFDPACYSHWSVLGYLGTKLLITGIEMACGDASNSVWAKGSAYIGATRFPVWAGVGLMLALQIPNFVMTGVGEESLFRGVYYEELSHRLGEWPAKITDALYFTVCHYPQQWDKLMAESPGQVAATTGLSMLDAFWFQYVYEWEGLRAAVATHAAVDTLAFFCDWLFQGGVPNSSGFSVGSKELSISVKLSLF